jgi:hypothetical protein
VRPRSAWPRRNIGGIARNSRSSWSALSSLVAPSSLVLVSDACDEALVEKQVCELHARASQESAPRLANGEASREAVWPEPEDRPVLRGVFEREREEQPIELDGNRLGRRSMPARVRSSTPSSARPTNASSSRSAVRRTSGPSLIHGEHDSRTTEAAGQDFLHALYLSSRRGWAAVLRTSARARRAVSAWHDCCSREEGLVTRRSTMQTTDTLPRTGDGREALEHSEGAVARRIEDQTAKLPSDFWLWTALASMGVSLILQIAERKEASLFVGQWAAPLLLFGTYNKLVKVGGSDRVHH